MKLLNSIILSSILVSFSKASVLHHRHVKRQDSDNGNVVELVYEEDVTYVIKKGPSSTLSEVVGTYSTFYTTTNNGIPTSAVAAAVIPSDSASDFTSIKEVLSSSIIESDSTTYVAPSSSIESSSYVAPSSSESSTYVAPTSVESSSSSIIASSYSSSIASSSLTSSYIAPSSTSSVESYSIASSSVESSSSSSVTIDAASTSSVESSSSSTTPVSTTSSSSVKESSSSSTTSASATASIDVNTNDYNSDFNTDMLSIHNIKRALHGVPDLAWNDTVATYAQNYADSYSCPSDGDLTHSDGPYGENLANGYPSAFGVVDAWYNEISDYDFANAGTDGFTESTGHFSQVIWKDTTQLGCAYKHCDTDYPYYVICSYYPAGNIIGADWTKEVPSLV